MTDSGEFTGRIALVTGGARNLGAAITRHLAGRGAQVIVNYFHATEAAEELREELERDGRSCDFIRASVAKHDAVDRMFDKVAQRYGGLDILVNNAAAGAFLPLFEADDMFWERAFRTNVMGALWCSKRAASLMRDRPGASITCLSSLGSPLTLLGYGTTGWTKAAVECLVRYLAVELAPSGIRVNALRAGMISDNDVPRQWDSADRLRQAYQETALLPRTISNEDVAALVGFLASGTASMITGETITADGGALAAPLLTTPITTNLRNTVNATADHPAELGEPRRPAAGQATVRIRDRVQGGESAPGLAGGVIAVVGSGAVLAHADSPEEVWERLREGAPLFSEPDRFDIGAYWSATPAPDHGYNRLGGFVGDFRPTAKLALEQREGEWPSDAAPAATLLRHGAIQAINGVATSSDDRWTCVTAAGIAPYPQVQQASLLGNGFQALASEHLGTDLAELATHAIAARYNSSALPVLDNIAPFAVSNALSKLVPHNAELICLDSACASSLHALDIAVRALREGSCDIALCSAVCILDPLIMVTFCKAQGLSPTGRVLPFQSTADGTLLGEGAVSLTLKTLERAQRDGDRILGLILGSGTGSDGKGKGVHAPTKEGQQTAILQAWDDAGVGPDDLDWIIAHGTGTPVGDAVELRALRESFGTRRTPCQLTSNKAVFGHTSLVAGLTSVLHALLAMEHEVIPPQPDFRDPHPDLATPGVLAVPTADVPWRPGNNRPRIVGVSGFGLGGSDAHVVLSDHVPQRRTVRAEVSQDDVVVTAWATELPGAADDWLARNGTAPQLVYGEHYPLPSPAEIRIPPLTMRHMDRTHLMALQATNAVFNQLGSQQRERLAPRTAVVSATTAPPHLYSRLLQRVSLDDCAHAFDLLPDRASAATAFEALREAVHSLTLESTEDDFTGTLTCVFSGRIANYFNLHGPNLVVHGGLDSGQVAIRTAERLLAHDRCDLALVCGANGNALPEWQQALASLLPTDRRVAEGCVTIALTRRSTALREGLPVLATVETAMSANWGGTAALDLPPLKDSGYCYPGIDALFAIPHSTLTSTAVDLVPTAAGAPHLRIRPAASREKPGSTPSRRAPIGVPMAYGLVDATAPAEAWGGAAADALPEGTLVLTDDEQCAAAAAALPGVHVWVPLAAPAGVQGVRVPPETAHEHVARLPRPPRHVRVLVRLAPTLHTDPPEDALALHDLAFAAVQAALPVLEAGGSLAALVLGAFRHGRPDPRAGLFDGLVRCVATETPQSGCATVLTDTDDVPSGLTQLAAEWRRHLPHHVIAYQGARRMQYALTPLIGASTPSGEPPALPLGPDSVVVSVGGGRGITAELLRALAEQARPHICVLGRTRIEGAPAGPAPDRTAFLRERRAQDPRIPLRELVDEHTSWSRADEVRRNIARLEQVCGHDKVHYLPCDILDEQALTAAIDRILSWHRRIDLLINSVVEVRSRATAAKPLEDFRIVRDTKVRGYHHLVKALTGRMPRIWCNFSTIGVLFGTPGDCDYVSASEYLNHATGTFATDGHREFTVLWPLWTDTGVASAPEVIEGFRDRGLTALLSTETGTAQFLDALAHPATQTVLAYIRDQESDTLGRLEQLKPAAPREHTQTLAEPLLDDTVLAGQQWSLFTRTFPRPDGSDQWIGHHLVSGTPVVPGTAVLEMAAEAAAHTIPELKVVGFRDFTCAATLTLNPSHAARTVKVEATILERGPDSARVRVEVRTHRRNATGRVLHHDDPCHSVDVLLSDEYPALARPYTDDTASHPVRVPVYTSNPIVHLSGPFAAAHNPRRTTDGFAAEFFFGAQQLGGGFTKFRIPAMMLEASIHLLTLPPAEAGDTGVLAVLQGITEIDLATPGNDTELISHLGGTIRLRCVSRHSGAQSFAIAPDGTVLSRIGGIRIRSLALLDIATGTTAPTTQSPVWWGTFEEAAR
ncbi:SDR family oxidoreductase [Catenulispora pinisilvae]|uniref:SDR family oxidoreductase n=1 Tax=Catenulispora pinisilvae TaxID=2705253 RepID=UPI0018920C8E|nr:SDR family oxidoreductase [Catenulispora pinisilvae]